MYIFVGNLSFAVTEADIRQLFERFGDVSSSMIVSRQETKGPRSRGFGFVEMPNEKQAFAAMTALDSKEFMGRKLTVNPARPGQETQKPVAPVRRKPGSYKSGRRTRSYMKRHGLGENTPLS